MDPRVPPLHPESLPSTEGKRDTDVQETSPKPKGITSAMWQKFQSLQKKRQEVTKASTEKRIKEIQREALQNVQDAFTTESEEAITQGYSITTNNSSRKRKAQGETTATISNSTTHESSSTSDGDQKGWAAIKPYLDVNSHLKGIDKGRYAPKTKLEEQIDEAIAKGDMKTAESLSDQLSTREFGTKIVDAIDASRFDDKRKQEQELLKTKRKKKLAWGFDHKERWEMKGNM